MNVHDNLEFKRLGQMLGAALEAKVMAGSPIYREPTLEDARELCVHKPWITAEDVLRSLKIRCFVRKVTPNE